MEIYRELPQGGQTTEYVPRGISLEELYDRHREDYTYTVLAAKVDNKVESLTRTLKETCHVEFLDMRNRAANLIFQGSLTLIYLKAVEDVLGRTSVEIQNSLNKGLYTEVRTSGSLSDADVDAIEARMKEIVSADLPFVETVMCRQEAMEFLESADLTEKKRLLEASPHVERVKFFSLGNFRNFFYGAMVPSTKYVKHFLLMKYRHGVLIRFPEQARPGVIPDYVDEKKMYSAFSEAMRWKSLVDIFYVTDLNNKIRQHQMSNIIQLSEALHEKKIVDIAEEITRKKKRIILIAGPSSSGKTTFARRLCVQLAVNGQKALYMGTDDYFVNREDTPLDENGEPDFEDLSALDIDLFNDNMNGLLAGQEVDLPTFDFMEGKKVFGTRITSIKRNQPIVIEGIHGLNDALTSHIDDEEKYRIYISPLTQLAIDSHNRIPTTDARMLRRMVRDFKYRGHSADSTILSWHKVRKGEDRNIFPYNGHADVFFNSAHIYEMSVLKKYAQPLLAAIGQDSKAYGEAARMMKYLEFFEIFEEDDIIANNSILREFIGGSIFV